jgi:hypothetical protein
MLRTIERHGELEIQKVYDQHGHLTRYQAGKPGDTPRMIPCRTLTEARAAIGVQLTAPVKTTKPKSECPQNQKGYKAPTK